MYSNKLKIWTAIILGLVLSLMSCFCALANWEDKDTSYAEWQYNWNGGSILCKWPKYTDTAAKTKGYELIVYKVSDSGSKTEVLKAEVTGKSKDVTRTILNKGAGSYYFTIRPYSGTYHEEDKSKKKTVTKYHYLTDAMTSETEIFDETELAKIKLGRSAVETNDNVSDGWHQYPGNNWTYGKGNNTLATNEWLDIDGKRYHFDSKGLMQKGWTNIGSAYYYLDPTNGYLWVNCTTPDGYTVNAEGARVTQSGTPVTGNQGVNATVTVNLTETGDPGKIKTAQVTGVTNASLVDWSFGTPYENWSVGEPVKLYVKVNPNTGFAFSNKSKFSAGNATFRSAEGSNPTTLTFDYYPKMKLSAPTNITVDASNIVNWTAVPGAQAYIVKIYGTSEGDKTETVDTNSYDLSSWIDGNDYIDVGVIAQHSKKGKSSKLSSYYSNSDETRLNGVSEMLTSGNTSDGRFVNSSGNLYYMDASGEKVKGWKQIQGKWYHFDNNGRASGPGWWQDVSGNWYYFDNQHVMQTGKINDGKGEYFMNDGSNTNLPLGAWVQQ